MGALAPGARQQWQFFLVTHNGVVEIQADGTIFYRPVLPAPVQDTARADASEDRNGDSPDKRPDFTSGDEE
ncbi:MAG: hypothetical protein WCB46_01820 [Methanoregula sp.]